MWDDTRKKPKTEDRIKVFTHTVLSGAISGILVTTIVHPLDLIKIRMQLYPGKVTTTAMARKIILCEGLAALYNGLTAAYLRQITFTTTRLAVYYGWHERFFRKHGIVPGLPKKINIGLWSGMAGALAGNPSDVALVRMMANNREDPCSVKERRKLYKGAFHAVYKIATTEGFWGLWRGGSLTVTRSACIGIVQIGSYVKAKSFLSELGFASEESDAQPHICASFISGFLTAIVTLPMDVIKTKFQIRSDNKPLRRVFLNAMRSEGVMRLWQGFFPYFMRLSLHTALTYYLVNVMLVIFGIFHVDK